MSNDIHLAFAHPDERAAASSADAAMRDRISVRDYVLEVEIGAFQVERGTTQRVRFNVAVEVVSAAEAAALDDVDRVLSYDKVTEAIDAVLAEERLNLLETLAERVADRILAEPQALRVFLRIEKIDRGPYALGVEIVRDRAGDPAAAASDDAAAITAPDEAIPHPRVVFLDNAAIADPRLKGRIDAWAADSAPLILAVGPAEGPAPQSAAPLAQRRIDLLAIEQNAWVLAGRDARCIVTGTRTELDWAMRHGQISVWAPSKMVLDAVDGPDASPAEAVALAAWFAGLMEAEELLVVGPELPAATTAAATTAAVPLRRDDLS